MLGPDDVLNIFLCFLMRLIQNAALTWIILNPWEYDNGPTEIYIERDREGQTERINEIIYKR